MPPERYSGMQAGSILLDRVTTVNVVIGSSFSIRYQYDAAIKVYV